MPDRTAPLLLAIIGAVTVLFTAALYINVRNAARRGPRWRRRLLSAGLVLLASFGFYSGAAKAAPAERAGWIAAKRGIAQTTEWKQIEAVWNDAVEVASGKRGSFPFDQAGKDKLRADLAAAKKAVQALGKAGRLSKAEVGLMVSDLDRLYSSVGSFRPSEMKAATCYKPTMYSGGARTLKWFEARLPLLEKMSADGNLKPAVLNKVLDRFDRDIAFLTDKNKSRDLKSAQRVRAAKLIEVAQKTIQVMRADLKTNKPKPKPPLPKPEPRRMCYAPMPMPPKDKSGDAGKQGATRIAATERVIRDGVLDPVVTAKMRARLDRDDSES